MNLNSPKGLTYVFTGLIAVTLGGYIYAKGQNEKKWNEKKARELRWGDKTAVPGGVDGSSQSADSSRPRGRPGLFS